MCIRDRGNGDYIVFYLNGKQEAGIADPESVREQIEPVVKNKLIAKKIIEKINASKATSLDAVAKLFATTKQSDQVNLFTPSVGGAMEPKVAGAAFGVKNGKTSLPAVSYTHLDVYKRQDVNQYNEWLKQRKSIEYRMMARQLFANISGGITANKKEATELLNPVSYTHLDVYKRQVFWSLL